MIKILKTCFVLASFFLFQNIFAGDYKLPESGNDIVGSVSYTTTAANESLVTIGQKYNLGVNAMMAANPGYEKSKFLPIGTPIRIPSKFLLPMNVRKGIVINLPEMRMYYFPEGSDKVLTFPIGIGKINKTIPITNTAITRKAMNPTWTPPKDIREFNKEQGIDLPSQIGPGPDNPLGPYAIYLKVPTYLIHSTIFPESIGTRASFGCIRMHETDIKEFFALVKPGTPVEIINIPVKLGWADNKLYLETHSPLEEHGDDGIRGIVSNIESAESQGGMTLINWTAVSYLAEQRDGVPHEIGFRVQD